MIFVTTGTQAPFNRLIRAMEEIAGELVDEEVVAQAFGVDFVVRNMKIVEFLTPEEYMGIFSKARLIISHAGMGTIISALKERKPIIIVPRIAAYGEHRNEHQLATANKIAQLNYMPVVYNMDELREVVLGTHSGSNVLFTMPELGDTASQSLISSIQEFMIAARKPR
ncbi:glycosyltransferase [Arcticibacter sp.]|jgi:UDP-N-acetylglucosamine transferase subunit ALG13|uniref:glycosyltransferase n=1 Tax=Arcticibacter sp. TaxID=1872630 RepID=UPI0038911237